MADPITATISLTALVVSCTTAWFTLFRRGTVKMTRPSFVAFSYDVSSDKPPLAKIFFRTLLYSTGKRGHAIENMFLIVHRGLEKQTFDIWGHGEDKKLSRGSGLFVGESGIAVNHHFNPLLQLPQQFFIAGEYKLDVFVELVGKNKPCCIATLKMTVPHNANQDMLGHTAAIWFNWEPTIKNYHGSVEKKPLTH